MINLILALICAVTVLAAFAFWLYANSKIASLQKQLLDARRRADTFEAANDVNLRNLHQLSKTYSTTFPRDAAYRRLYLNTKQQLERGVK